MGAAGWIPGAKGRPSGYTWSSPDRSVPAEMAVSTQRSSVPSPVHGFSRRSLDCGVQAQEHARIRTGVSATSPMAAQTTASGSTTSRGSGSAGRFRDQTSPVSGSYRNGSPQASRGISWSGPWSTSTCRLNGRCRYCIANSSTRPRTWMIRDSVVARRLLWACVVVATRKSRLVLTRCRTEIESGLESDPLNIFRSGDARVARPSARAGKRRWPPFRALPENEAENQKADREQHCSHRP